jgi:hypothetical protein
MSARFTTYKIQPWNRLREYPVAYALWQLFCTDMQIGEWENDSGYVTRSITYKLPTKTACCMYEVAFPRPGPGLSRLGPYHLAGLFYVKRGSCYVDTNYFMNATFLPRSENAACVHGAAVSALEAQRAVGLGNCDTFLGFFPSLPMPALHFVHEEVGKTF